ncbi:MAG: hypothetical protein M3Y08_02495 [Fibrobacterota bacterium]|nr:hypothetical protein [Fibrobacterota bacterium]
MEETQLKLLAFLSDEGQHFTEEFIENVGEESEIEAALEHLIANGHVVSGERGSYTITEEGTEAYNEQVERDGVEDE